MRYAHLDGRAICAMMPPATASAYFDAPRADARCCRHVVARHATRIRQSGRLLRDYARCLADYYDVAARLALPRVSVTI